jgi:hypothetical protein
MTNLSDSAPISQDSASFAGEGNADINLYSMFQRLALSERAIRRNVLENQKDQKT